MRPFRNQSGFGILEVVIAAAILLVMGYLVLDQVTGHQKFFSKIRKSSVCTNLIANMGTQLELQGDVLPPFFGRPGQDKSMYFDHPQFQKFSRYLPKELSSKYWAEDGAQEFSLLNTDGTVYPSQLILNSVSLWQAIYNWDPRLACEGRELPAQVLGDVLPAGWKLWARVEPVQENGARVGGGCYSRLKSKPLSQTQTDVAYGGIEGDPSLGYHVEILATSPEGEECRLDKTIRHRADLENTAKPTIDPALVKTGRQEPLRGDRVPTVCDTDSLMVPVKVSNLEPGSLPLCRTETNLWPCALVKFPEQTGATRLELVNQELRLVFEGLAPNRLYHLGIRLVDAAGNLSPEAELKFAVDTQAPTISSIFTGASARFNSRPKTTGQGTELVQCGSDPLDFYILYSNDPLKENWEVCRGDGVSESRLEGNKCLFQFRSPSKESGQRMVFVSGGDPCHPVRSAPFSWKSEPCL